MKKNTNTYKSILGLSAVVALIGMPVAAMAGTVSLSLSSSLGNYSFGNGSANAGEFAASIQGETQAELSAPGGLGYVNGVTSTGGSFETFCVQNSVDVNTGTPYSYTEASQTGGPKGPTTEGGIALSEGAAFLYYEFATGGLNGSLNYETAASTYNYANGSTTGKNAYSFSRVNDAGELQAAIWFFMGEPALTGWPSTSGSPSSDPFVVLAEDVLGSAQAFDADGTATGEAGDLDYGVAIMQLTSDNGAVVNQNQLILTGTGATCVPDGGLTLAMLGMGLAGLFFVNLQRTKSVARQN